MYFYHGTRGKSENMHTNTKRVCIKDISCGCNLTFTGESEIRSLYSNKKSAESIQLMNAVSLCS